MNRLFTPLTTNSWYYYQPDFLSVSYDSFREIWNLSNNVKHYSIKMFGKTSPIPRKQSLYSDVENLSYKFSGMKIEAQPIPQPILKLLENKSFDYNAVFVNWYRDGSDYISAHSDDEKDLIPNSEIVSISLGETRIFRVKSKLNKIDKYDFRLSNGSLYIMGGDFQKEFTHEIPKSKKLNGKRINITLRKFKI